MRKHCPRLPGVYGMLYRKVGCEHTYIILFRPTHSIALHRLTLFHELAHSTGHASRVGREGFENPVHFGSEDYSKEELVAECTAAMLCGVTGIDTHTLDNSTAYLQSWIARLKSDSKLIVQAASAAQKAADYIRNADGNAGEN